MVHSRMVVALDITTRSVLLVMKCARNDGTLLAVIENVECRTCRYVEERGEAERDASANVRVKESITTKWSMHSVYKNAERIRSKPRIARHRKIFIQITICNAERVVVVGRTFDSGRGCNRRPGRVTQDRVCTSCHSQCRSPPWWRYHHEHCNGPRDNQCRFDVKL